MKKKNRKNIIPYAGQECHFTGEFSPYNDHGKTKDRYFANNTGLAKMKNSNISQADNIGDREKIKVVKNIDKATCLKNVKLEFPDGTEKHVDHFIIQENIINSECQDLYNELRAKGLQPRIKVFGKCKLEEYQAPNKENNKDVGLQTPYQVDMKLIHRDEKDIEHIQEF